MLAGAALMSGAPAAAHPDGAPWGAADPAGDTRCSSCHFDAPATENASALRLDGVPADIAPGRIYELVLQFTPSPDAAPGAVRAGILLGARSETGSAGVFIPPADDGSIEASGSEVRSTAPAPLGAARWRLRWRAPDEPIRDIVFDAAAIAGNDDASPFGDAVFFRSFSRD